MKNNPDAKAVSALPVGNRVNMVQTGGSDPPSQPLQGIAENSQLSLHVWRTRLEEWISNHHKLKTYLQP